jgi:hypothetical protein
MFALEQSVSFSLNWNQQIPTSLGICNKNKKLFRFSENLFKTTKGFRKYIAIISNDIKGNEPIILRESLFIMEQNVAGLLKEKIIRKIPEFAKTKASILASKQLINK